MKASALLGFLLVAGMIGCNPVEHLVVPPRAAMLGQVHLNQLYVLNRATTMDAMNTGDVQPEIHLSYDKGDILPAEAFERVPFPLGDDITISSTDPNATAISSPHYRNVAIPAGSQLAVSVAEGVTNVFDVLVGRREVKPFAHIRAYESKYTGVTAEQMRIYADTTLYVINRGGKTDAWSGNVDGSGTTSKSMKADFIFLAQFNHRLFRLIAQSNIDANQINAGTERAKNTGYILYMKHWLATH